MQRVSSQRGSRPQAAPLAHGDQAPAPRWVDWLVAAGLLLAPLVMTWPYLKHQHAEDDLDHLVYVAEYREGARTTFTYLLAPVNEHLLPAWRVWYYLSWRMFGLEAAGWHVAMALVHGFSAVMLFVVLRAYTGHMLAAGGGAGLWSIAGIGGWDNPLSWIPASHLAFGLAWIVAAMACTTRYRDRRQGLWAALLAGCLLLAVSNMSAMWVLTPIVAVQWLLLERRPGERWWPRWPWLLGWGAPFVLTGGLAIAAALGVFSEGPQQPTGHNLLAGPLRTMASWSITLENLLYRDATQTPENFLLRTLVGGVLLVAPFFVPGVNVRLLATILFLVLPYTALVHVARSNFPEEYALHAGRYAYLPVLGWCAVIGTLLAVPWFYATSRRRLALLGALLVATLWLIPHQAQLVRGTTVVYQAITKPSRDASRRSTAMLDWLSDQGVKRQRAIRIPDFTWVCRPTRYSLDQFLDVIVRHPTPGLEVVSAAHWTENDLADFDRVVQGTNNPFRWTFYDSLTAHLEAAQVLSALESQAAAGGGVLRVPDFEITIPMAAFLGRGESRPFSPSDKEWRTQGAILPLSALARRLFGADLPHLRFVGHEELTYADTQNFLHSLGAINLPMAAQWHTALADQFPPDSAAAQAP